MGELRLLAIGWLVADGPGVCGARVGVVNQGEPSDTVHVGLAYSGLR